MPPALLRALTPSTKIVIVDAKASMALPKSAASILAKIFRDAESPRIANVILSISIAAFNVPLPKFIFDIALRVLVIPIKEITTTSRPLEISMNDSPERILSATAIATTAAAISTRVAALNAVVMLFNESVNVPRTLLISSPLSKKLVNLSNRSLIDPRNFLIDRAIEPNAPTPPAAKRSLNVNDLMKLPIALAAALKYGAIHVATARPIDH